MQATSFFAHASAPQKTIVLGVLAYHSKAATENRWKPLVRYLNKALPNKEIRLRALDFEEMEAAIGTKEIDLVLTQPAHYVLMGHQHALSAPIATMVNSYENTHLYSYGGVIAVLSAREDLRNLSDLNGRTIGIPSRRSFGGYLAQLYELHKANLPQPEKRQLIEIGMSHDDVVMALLAGKVDAAFVRAGVIEAMEKGGVIRKGQLHVLNARKETDFPYALSTDLYSEWPVAALPHLGERVAVDVATALFQFPHDGEVAKEIGIHGFVVPADYRRVEVLLRTLRHALFDKTPTFSFNDIWLKYSIEMIAGSLFFAIVLILLAILTRFNRRLDVLRMHAEVGNARLEELSEHLPGMIYQYRQLPDGSSHYPYASKAAHELFALDPEDLKKDAAPFFSRLHPDDVEAYCECARESARTLSSWKGAYRVILPDGRVCWREGVALPSRQADGSILWQGFVMDITERKQLEEALAYESDLRMQVLSSLGEGVLGIDLQERILFVNARALEMLGWTEKELVGEKLNIVMDKKSDAGSGRSEGESEVYIGVENGAQPLVKDWLVRKNGSRFPVAMLMTAIERQGVVWGRVISFRDITRQQEAEAQTLLLVTALEASANAIVITDLDTNIEWVNPAFCAMTGYEFEEVIDHTPAELVKSGHHDAAFYEKMWAVLLEGNPWRGEFVNRRKDGSLFDEEVIITPVSDASGKVHHYIGVKQDIGERKRMEQELRSQASTDMLTGLPNRRSFFGIAEAELARIKRGKEKSAVLIMLDLDHFKSINDTYGHGVGDLVLQHLAATVSNTLRLGDFSGRLGGEEFGILLPETSIKQAHHFAERLRQEIANSVIDVEGTPISYTASLGLTAMIESDHSFETALSRADDAMYRAKNNGRNRVEVL